MEGCIWEALASASPFRVGLGGSGSPVWLWTRRSHLHRVAHVAPGDIRACFDSSLLTELGPEISPALYRLSAKSSLTGRIATSFSAVLLYWLDGANRSGEKTAPNGGFAKQMFLPSNIYARRE